MYNNHIIGICQHGQKRKVSSMLVITAERKAREWSMSRLAREADLHVSTISLIESRRMKPYSGQIEKLVLALQWEGDPSALFEEKED